MPRRATLLVLLCAAVLALLPWSAADAAPRRQAPALLRIVHTNDHHGHLDPILVDGVLQGGMARRSTIVAELRADSAARQEPMLLLDAGDTFQGTPFVERYQGMADLELYNALGYDAVTVGNHEFDHGDAFLANIADGASFPLLSANLRAVAPSPLAGKVAPWTIVERQGLRIGIFGLTTPDTTWLSTPGPGVSFDDPTAAAERAVAELQIRGVNVIVALVHLGMSEEVKLLDAVRGIDVMLGGHSHTRLPSGDYPRLVTRADGSLAVYATAYQYGQIVGDLEVQFDAQGRVTSGGGREIVVDERVVADPAVQARVDELR
jgi:5'-nucleotidase/UDP-sugar diphosphatase